MDLTSRQMKLSIWAGVAVGSLVLIAAITFGGFRAKHINEAAHARWHETRGQMTSLSPWHGVNHPDFRSIQVSYRQSHNTALKLIEVTPELFVDWAKGDTIKMWYGRNGETFIPADRFTKGSKPFPVVAGTIVWFSIAGLVLALTLGVLAGTRLAALFKRHNGMISNSGLPLKSDLLW